MLAAIEAGGTKIVCAVAEKDNVKNIIERRVFQTKNPEETIPQILDFFKLFEIEAFGIGSFGPIDVDPDSKTYGYITNTPKLKWRQFDFLGVLKQEFYVPMFWTTDVNAAAYGELIHGAAINCKNCVYITVGTGIGGSVIIDRKIIGGRSHPEIGHIFVNQLKEDNFEGGCPSHKNCLEGLASGQAIEQRTGKKAQSLPVDHSIWEIETEYLAQACVNYTLSFSPEKIIFGGGVMKQEHLFPKIQEKFLAYLGDYIEIKDCSDYIVSCQLKDDAGVIGGLSLAYQMIADDK